MKMRKVSIVLLVFALLTMSVLVAPVSVSADNTVIREYKGADLTKYANTGKSLDNTGYAERDGNPPERANFTKVEDGNIVFEAAKDEFLPGGFVFATKNASGVFEGGMKIDEITGLQPNQKVRVVYVLNIDPISKDYTARMFAIEGLDGGGNFGLKGSRDNWGGENIANQIDPSWLGKDIEIVSPGTKTADANGKIAAFNLVNYTTAHYPALTDAGNSSMAPFKITYKAIKIVADGYVGTDYANPAPADPTEEPTEEPNPETPATGDVSLLLTLVLAGASAFGGLKLRKK